MQFRRMLVWGAAMMLSVAMLSHAQEVSLDPATGAPPAAGTKLVVTLKVTGIKDLFGWQIDVQFDSKVLKFVSFEEGAFLKAGGPSFAVPAKEKDVAGNADANRAVTVGATLLGAGSASGDGDLGKVTFDVVAKANSKVPLAGAKFLDRNVKEIPVTVKGAEYKEAVVENKAPVAVGKFSPTAPKVNESVAFDGTGSTDADGTIAKYAWDFGDTLKGEGNKPTHAYAKEGTYNVVLTVTDDKGATASATITVAVTGGKPILREHTNASPSLVLEATFPTVDTHGHAYINIWKGEWKVAAGQWLEYQVSMWSGNPAFQASIDLATANGKTLRDVKGADGKQIADQNGLLAHPAADLSAQARDKWYHRQISLDALAGETVTEINFAVDSDKHRAGLFRAFADNVQITDKTFSLADVYLDGANVPLPTPVAKTTTAGNGGINGMTEASVQAGVTAVAVSPLGKLATTWGSLKGAK